MKKLKTISTMLLSAALASAMVSCSDNDDNDPALPSAQDVAGSYSSDMTCTVAGSESVFENVTFTVTAVDDATVTVAVPSFGNPPMQVPGFDVTGVKVSGTEGQYVLASTDFSGTTDSGRAFSGTLQGSMNGEVLTVMFNLQYGAMPMPMICTFTAAKN